MKGVEPVVVELPHGLHAVYILRSYEPPPYVMTSAEHAEAVKHAAAREQARRNDLSPDDCPF